MRISYGNSCKYSSSCWSYRNCLDIAPGNFILLGDKIPPAARYSRVLLSQGKRGGGYRAGSLPTLPTSFLVPLMELLPPSPNEKRVRSIPFILAVQWGSYAVEDNRKLYLNPSVKECFSAQGKCCNVELKGNHFFCACAFSRRIAQDNRI